MPTNTRGGPAGIALTGLTKSFRTGQGVVHAVRGVDISVGPGETVALLGPNGAGKSTTIDMLLGLLPPDAGTVVLFGRRPREAVQAGSVGAMLQVDEVLELTGTAGFARQRTQKLSGGQSQRVRFALALVSNPDLLVLDEPTVGMDVEGRHAFWTAMRGFAAGGATVLFATHYLEEADSYADRIILMARGTVVADGPASEIKAAVGSRTIQATLPDADPTRLAALPGVLPGWHGQLGHHGGRGVQRCADRHRPGGRLDPAAPAHAAVGPDVPASEGAW